MYVNVLYLEEWYVRERTVLAGVVCTLTYCTCRCCMYVNALYLQVCGMYVDQATHKEVINIIRDRNNLDLKVNSSKTLTLLLI